MNHIIRKVYSRNPIDYFYLNPNELEDVFDKVHITIKNYFKDVPEFV